MIIRSCTWVAVAILLAVPTLCRADAKLLRHPTYADGRVAFSYLGDIWLAKDDGSAVERITTHRARDVYPRFSPDGSQIAFSSNREGNYDVYVVSAKGGKPRQLTFHSADDFVTGWTPDGKRILFSSTRGNGAFPSVATLFTISVDGGMEQPVPTDWGSWGSYSPDGAKLAFTRHPGVWSRKHYRGSYSADLWLMDVGEKTFTRLGGDDYAGNCLWPMYGHDGDIYFVADRLADEKHVKFGGAEVMKSANNIWKIPQGGGTPVQVTHHTSGNLFFPSMSADGKTIVYEESFGIRKLDLASGKSTEIKLEILSDSKENDVQLKSIESETEDFSLSPSTRRAAIGAHGEIFTIATDRGDVHRVTETPWREQRPRWSPNGKWIAFVSDRSGREEIWLADELGNNLKQISDADCDKQSIQWSPKSDLLAWSGSDHKLRTVDIEKNKTEVVVSSDVGPISYAQFSPDQQWISYSKQDALLRSQVFVKPLAGGEEHVIASKEFLVATGARWTPDGKRLVLLGGVGTPAMSALNRTTLQLYSILLTRTEKRPTDRDVDTEAQAQAAVEAARGLLGTGIKVPVRIDVKIDWDGIDRRVKQLSHVSGSVSLVVPSPDGKTYAFVASSGGDESTGGPGLYTVNEDGSRQTSVIQESLSRTTEATVAPRTSGGIHDPQWSKTGRSIFFLQSGNIYSVSVAGTAADDGDAAALIAKLATARSGEPSVASASAGATPRKVVFTARLEIDLAAERRQIFDEAWRVMRNRFYDPKMHGVDWDAAKATYEPLLEHVADAEELHTVLSQMIGELNASHTGVSGSIAFEAGQERTHTNYPGFDLEPDESGYYKVAAIYKQGPADHDYVKLAVGNFILDVNGKPLKTSDNYWKAFNLIPGRRFEFSINSKPATAGAWKVRLEPFSSLSQSNLQYDRWVENCQTQVDTLSNHEVGYLHIKSMNAAALQKFQRDLLDNLGKKALIIDERFNGGGGIDQELLSILVQRRYYQSYRYRDSIEIKRPAQAFIGPMAVLQNERSASNAEMFPDGFRELGLGQVVGVPTMGAVIGTNSYRLIDGSTIRTPGVGVYTAKGESLENYGVPPDVKVDNLPADFLSGKDRQIEAALKVLDDQRKKP